MTIRINEFVECLRQNGVNFFAGVPDSLLKEFSIYLAQSAEHIICANEGAAVAMASGHFLATGSPALVYMQNSGFGNAINPLLSLASPDVYALPMVLLIGWRGEPGVPDEPQHAAQGRLMLPMLDTLEIPHVVIGPQTVDWKPRIEKSISWSIDIAERTRIGKKGRGPSAIVIKKDTFEGKELGEDTFTNIPRLEFDEDYNERKSSSFGKLQPATTTAAAKMKESFDDYPLSREEAIRILLDTIGDDEVIVCTTGMASRELFEFRERARFGHGNDFLTVGCMGHSNQIALAIARLKKEKTVHAIDGDGSIIMHMGSMAIVGTSNCKNYRHIVLNNGAHDSVGGQPTVGLTIDLPNIARACGYSLALRASSEEEIRDSLKEINKTPGPTLLEIRIHRGARPDLGRPSVALSDLRDEFITFVRG